MKVDTTNKFFLCILIIAVILLLSLSMSNAQLTFFNPLYYAGSYPSPSFYPFFPLYDPFFPAYNSIPLLPVYNTAYFNPIPALPTALPTPVINPNPVASVSAATTLVTLTPITTIAGVIIADFLINTGNPQVNAVLNLIIQNPALLDNPILLNSLINTGNPNVAAALAWLTLVI